MKKLWSELGDRADKLVSLHNRVGCKPALDQAFLLYKRMNKINRMLKHKTGRNAWE
jgi:hypothetical protein